MCCSIGQGLSVVGTRVSILVSPSSGAAVVGGHVCACVSDPVLHIGDLYQGGDHDLYNRVRGQLRRKKSPVVVSHMLSCSSACTDVAVCTQPTQYRGFN